MLRLCSLIAAAAALQLPGRRPQVSAPPGFTAPEPKPLAITDNAQIPGLLRGSAALAVRLATGVFVLGWRPSYVAAFGATLPLDVCFEGPAGELHAVRPPASSQGASPLPRADSSAKGAAAADSGEEEEEDLLRRGWRRSRVGRYEVLIAPDAVMEHSSGGGAHSFVG